MTSSSAVFPPDFRVLFDQLVKQKNIIVSAGKAKNIQKGPEIFLLSRRCRVNLELKGNKPITRTGGELKVI